ncbi:hypothetical protein ACFQJD_17580 [Haloplanus sp. GCM10025708]
MLVSVTVLYAASSLFQLSGAYFAHERVRWPWATLASFAGVLFFVGIPFAALAVICLGLGKYHFSAAAPSE